uniref:Pleckstrin homology domain containing, family A member 5 n=1 Tax=Fundulus heteroclitus TaxID=8078 RepID=A0A3Q2TBR8_FUNHE
ESSTDKKDRPMSIMSEASNYTGGSDYSTFPGSPATTPSRSSKKVHNFGKRSNSIKRNLNAPVIKRNWLYKQDSTGMKLWKKRWFVLSDMCLFYYRGKTGSCRLPASTFCFLHHCQATHPNMRTYYFCTDTAKEMECWMKVMTDAALVHTEPAKRSLNADQQTPQQWNNLLNHAALTQPEIQNNERNREPARQHSLSRADDKRLKDIEKQNSQKDLGAQKPLQVKSSGSRPGEQPGDRSQMDETVERVPLRSPAPVHEPDGGLLGTNSIQQLEPRLRTHRTRELDDDTRSVMSYQTLPRNMPSHRGPIVPCYPEGYRTLPRNSMMRPDSICSVAGSVYDRALRPVSTIGTAEKRRSMKDDTMWQLYEWQQRQAFSRQTVGHYGTLPSTKTMGNISEHAVARSISTSPSHGSLALYSTFSPPHQQAAPNPSSSLSEVSSPVLRGDGTLDRRQRSHLTKVKCTLFQGQVMQNILFQNTSDTLKSLAVCKTLNRYRERLCEKDKVLRMQEEKLQQLHREKHTLETALLSASQELGEQSSSNTAATQSLVQQRDVLQSGLRSTCRELSRVTAELERSWRDYERLEADVTLARTNLLEQLEALGSPQTEPPSQRHIQIQKELWRIQDVMEALSKNKPKQRIESGFPGAKPLSSQQKNEQAPDYRLYKSEPELTTVKEEGDEANGEDKDKTETSAEMPPYPVGIVAPRTKSPMSPPESSTIASYVTLRKIKKPEPRCDRPKSAVDQMAFGEREFIRTRMSVEEQLERMRRNQEASSLREKRRETLSRSSSFSKDNPLLHLQVMLHINTQLSLQRTLNVMNVTHVASAKHSFQTPSPEPKEQETDGSPTPSQEEHLEKSLNSYKQLTGDSKKQNINNNMPGKSCFSKWTEPFVDRVIASSKHKEGKVKENNVSKMNVQFVQDGTTILASIIKSVSEHDCQLLL